MSRTPLMTQGSPLAYLQRIFDIAKIYGGDVVLPPINKKKVAARSSPLRVPPPELLTRDQKSKASLGGGKSTKHVPGFVSLAEQENERLDAIRRKVSPSSANVDWLRQAVAQSQLNRLTAA